MRITRKHDRHAATFEDYGFTTEEFRAWRASALGRGGPGPSPEKAKRIEAWLEADHAARQGQKDARAERHRRFWFGVWSLVGIASIVVITAAFTLGHKAPSNSTLAEFLIFGISAGIGALLGRELTRKP